MNIVKITASKAFDMYTSYRYDLENLSYDTAAEKEYLLENGFISFFFDKEGHIKSIHKDDNGVEIMYEVESDIDIEKKLTLPTNSDEYCELLSRGTEFLRRWLSAADNEVAAEYYTLYKEANNLCDFYLLHSIKESFVND